jgi:hypothetical protein
MKTIRLCVQSYTLYAEGNLENTIEMLTEYTGQCGHPLRVANAEMSIDIFLPQKAMDHCKSEHGLFETKKNRVK